MTRTERAQAAEIGVLYRTLESLRWADHVLYGGEYIPVCPTCGCGWGGEHADDCTLENMLSAPGGHVAALVQEMLDLLHHGIANLALIKYTAERERLEAIAQELHGYEA